MMKRIYFLILVIVMLSLTTIINAQSKSYLDMSEQEKTEFVTTKINEITNKIAGKQYAFDAKFQLQVANYLESYAKRVGSGIKGRAFGQDLNFVLQRGSESAPMINAAFDKNGVSRLAGLYIAMIESEFNNNVASQTGSTGMFQLTTAQAKMYRMTKKDTTNLSKSAEIAARYLNDNLKKFEPNKMKEFLAILSWNRTVKKINFDLSFKFMDESKYRACAICGLSEYPQRFDQQFQTESVKYIPKFLAAAIVGENPSDFGLNTKPLSLY